MIGYTSLSAERQLYTEEDILEYLCEALVERNRECLAFALATIAASRGILLTALVPDEKSGPEGPLERMPTMASAKESG